jgi:multidrug transporter EmrE-like cation transporter
VRLDTLALIVISVVMSACAQLMLKGGMGSSGASEPLVGQRLWQLLMHAATNRWVILGLCLYFLSAVVWLAVLARVDVSYAYPFVSLGFIMTMVLGWLVFGDVINAHRLGGTMLIATGVVLIARGG